MRYLLINPIIILIINFSVIASESSGNIFKEPYRLIDEKQYESAIFKINNLLSRLNDVNHIGEAYFTLGYVYNETGKPFKAIQYYLQAADYYTKPDCLSNTYENLGLIYKGFNQHSIAIYYFTEAIRLEKANSERLMKKLYTRSASYRRNDQTNLALEDLLRAEEIAFQKKRDTFRAKIYNQLGLLFKFRGDYSMAGSYFFQALQIDETRDTYHNYANLKKELGDTVLAEQYFLKAIEISDEDRLITTYIDLGELYFHWNKPNQADLYLSHALDIYKRNGDAVFNHVKLFEVLAKATSDVEKAGAYKDSAIARYKNIGVDLKQSNELFFGAIANEKTQNLEIKRAYIDRVQGYNIAVTVIVILAILLVTWLIIRIRKRAKERIIRKTFERIQNIMYEE